MKQKKGNVSLKSPLNSVKNDSIVKKQHISGANTPAKGTPGKVNQKKTGKTPVKVVPPKKVEEEEVDDSEEEEDSGADVAAGVADDAGDSGAEEQDEDVAEDEDEDDEDEDEDGGNGDLDNDAEQDDDEPVEAPIGRKTTETQKVSKSKKAKAAVEIGVPKIKTGALPKDFPQDQVLVVKNLPKQYKQIDLVEIFAKYGTLHTIHNIHGPVSSVAYIAYTAPEEAEAAQAATDNNAKVKGVTINVNVQTPNPKKVKKAESKQKASEEKQTAIEDKKRKIQESKSRTVYIKSLKSGTTEDQVREHFAECGEIESVNVFSRHQHSYGFVCFEDESSIAAATKLHNSVLNGMNIWVLQSDQQVKEVTKDPQRTILIKNNQSLESIDPAKLDSIFSKCGEIESTSILCKKNVLAFITFKDEKGAKKALKLNGSSSQGLDLEIEEYKVITPKHKTTVFIQNVKPGVTENEIREIFASTGPIESVNVLGGFATVKFEDTESFCKAFLLNETYIRGQLIFLEPYSERKQSILRNQNRKRPAPFNKGGHSKKLKTN
ncbi:PREDICTED: DNA-binding protein modulo [Rhagoletis zephyria]|uniref:DNA-binding protein modulo n=1 Tax=Rhagoletis zephyria TaxID=28612 RepID=UPI000811399C|nr:PREDICTED: DNA-binding protein modulo [Rhagoletis zephyria]